MSATASDVTASGASSSKRVMTSSVCEVFCRGVFKVAERSGCNNTTNDYPDDDDVDIRTLL